jgi:rRNA pseudouridine-1189 N-methylase Emg1 (Nep1/Mra1 family)
MLTLILAESSLEIIPPKTRKYALTKTQNRKGKKRDKIILDVSLHSQTMKKEGDQTSYTSPY